MTNIIKSHCEEISIVLCFLFFSFFFSTVHPIYIFCSDDWTYIAATRSGIPDIHNWNPTRILPEILMPLCSDLAISVVYPILMDIQDSITIIFSLVLSFFITIYIYSFYCLLKKYSRSFASNVFICMLFTLLHFMVFRVEDSENIHLFYSNNATNYFYYTIPNLICASITFWGINKTSLHLWYKSMSFAGKGLFILLIYISLLSNIFSNIILVAFAFTIVIKNLYNIGVKNIRIYHLSNNSTEVIIVLAWLLVAIFESFGGRADSLTSQEGFIAIFLETVQYLILNILTINPYFTLIIGVSIILYSLIFKNNKRSRSYEMWTFLGILVISFLYLPLLCTVSRPLYIQRSDVLFPFFYAMISLSMLMFDAIIKKKEYLTVFLPLIVFLVYCETNTYGRTFRGVQDSNCTEYKGITNNILKQIQEADKEHRDSVYIYVPKYQSADNWPISLYHGERLSNSLYKYGFISKPMHIIIVPKEQE